MWNIYFTSAVTIIVLGTIIARIKYVDFHGDDNKKDLSEAVWSIIITILAAICVVLKREHFFSNPISIAALIIISIELLWLLMISISLIRSIASYSFLKYCIMLLSTKEAVNILLKKGYEIKNKSRYLIKSEEIYFWIIDDKYVISLSGILMYEAPEEYETIEVGEVIEIGYLKYKLEIDAVKELFLTEQEYNGKEKLNYTY